MPANFIMDSKAATAFKPFAGIIICILAIVPIRCAKEQIVSFHIENIAAKAVHGSSIAITDNVLRVRKETGAFIPGEKRTLEWDIDGILRTDGGFEAVFHFDNGDSLRAGFGHISNGFCSERLYSLQVTDTVITVKTGR